MSEVPDMLFSHFSNRRYYKQLTQGKKSTQCFNICLKVHTCNAYAACNKLNYFLLTQFKILIRFLLQKLRFLQTIIEVVQSTQVYF